MPIFEGPVALTRSLASRDPREIGRNPAAYRLFRHYGAQPDGVNVYIIDDVVTTSDPTAEQWESGAIRALWGGHLEPVTDAEAALLTAAGYGDYLSG